MKIKRLICLTLSAAMMMPMCACNSTQKRIEENKYASASLELMLNICEDYYSLEKHMLKGEPTAGSGDCFVWAFGSFLEALGDNLALYPENETLKTYYLDALNEGIKRYKVKGSVTTPTGTHKDITYYNASVGNRGDYYYDDNAWICLQFLRAYELLGDKIYLEKAEELLKFFGTGIDDTLGGGIYWDKSFSSKNTCSDGPVAIAYLWAHKITGNSDYLEKGKRLVSWMNDNLRDTDGLYWDNINTDGEINKWKADYNQGTPLYALSLLYEITNEEEYKTLADQTAKSALGLAFTVRGSGENKTVKMNGNPIYKSWCVGWLMRGFEQYISIRKDEGKYFEYMEKVLDDTLETKNAKGYYDPYFCSGDWTSESTTEVLQPCGVASVLSLCAYHDVYVSPQYAQ